jgi:hypothetical protein
MTNLPPMIYPPLAWLEAEENCFGIRCLDVRGLTQAYTSTSTDSKTTAGFQRLRSSTGEACLAETRDWPAGFACDLRYPPLPGFSQRPLFSARDMEDKWDIFYLSDGRLYFCRSWTGTPVMRAAVQANPDGLHLTWLDFNPTLPAPDPAILKSTVDFLVKSHLFGLRVPVQVPRQVLFHLHGPDSAQPAGPETDEHPNEPEQVAKYLFSEFGQRACFAALADTTALPIRYDRASLIRGPLEPDAPHLLAEIRANRSASRRPPYDPLDDDLTWTLFRCLENSRMLEMVLASMHGGPLSALQVMYWGWDQTAQRTWAAFKAAARLFGETPAPGAGPDLIIQGSEALFFILARFKGSFNYSARNASAGPSYTSASAGWYGKVFQRNFETVALERKKYELMRAWLIGSKIASQTGQAFYLVTISPDGLARQMDAEFGSLIVQNEERAYLITSWEQMIQFIERSGPPTLQNQRILASLEDRLKS